MTPNETEDATERSLEDHERAVKRSLASLGSLEDRFHDVVDEATQADRERLEPLGRALETHVERLETLVRTLDDHKRAFRDEEGGGSDPLGPAVERARRRARQEPTPPGSTDGDDTQRS